MDKCSEKRLSLDIEHLSSSEDPCNTAAVADQQQQTIDDSTSVNLTSSLRSNIKPFDISRPWLNKNWRWQKHIKPPENGRNEMQENSFINSTAKMQQYQEGSLKLSSKRYISCSSGSKRRTIYGGSLASTFSVFLIKCLIVATAYDDKFVNKL